MKKILFLVAMSMISIAGFSQSNFNQTVANPTGALLNTTPDTMTVFAIHDYNFVGIQPVITKATGTQAGTAILNVSLDGVNWQPVIGDTLTLSNVATNTTIWRFDNPVYNYYRIIVSGATTVTGFASAKFTGKHPNH